MLVVKNILIFLKDGTKRLFIPSVTETPEECLENATLYLEQSGEEVERHFLVDPDFINAETVGSVVYTKHGVLRLDRKSVVQSKINEARIERASLFLGLDLASLMSLETKDSESTAKILEIKKFLRDIPQTHKLNMLPRESDILRCNLFNNVMFITVTKAGSGYTKPPTVTIDPPKQEAFIGFTAKAVAKIENNKISEIKLVDHGSNYVDAPNVSISPPDSPNGTQATAKAELSNMVEIKS